MYGWVMITIIMVHALLQLAYLLWMILCIFLLYARKYWNRISNWCKKQVPKLKRGFAGLYSCLAIIPIALKNFFCWGGENFEDYDDEVMNAKVPNATTTKVTSFEPKVDLKPKTGWNLWNRFFKSSNKEDKNDESQSKFGLNQSSREKYLSHFHTRDHNIYGK